MPNHRRDSLFRKRVTAAACVLGLCAMSTPAQAACSVSSTGIAFGAYQPLTFAGKLTSADVLTTGTVSVVCNNIVTFGSFTIALGPSTVSDKGSTTIPRYLANNKGGESMKFNIYIDAGRSTVWTDMTGQMLAGTVPITVGSVTQDLPIYGKIPGGQNTLKAGSFSGVLTMTMTYSP